MVTREAQLEQLISDRDVLSSQLSVLNKKIFDLAQEMIPDYAKYQVDQEINDRGNIYKITKVIASVNKRYTTGENYLSFQYYGRKVLKTGNLHKNESKLYWLDWQ